jgi:hypothetical protein
VQLREQYDEDLLRKELTALGVPGAVASVANPWYVRRENTDTWMKIGESTDQSSGFPVRWDTTQLENGVYEVMGLMHVSVRKGEHEVVVARQNVVDVTVEN